MVTGFLTENDDIFIRYNRSVRYYRLKKPSFSAIQQNRVSIIRLIREDKSVKIYLKGYGFISLYIL